MAGLKRRLDRLETGITQRDLDRMRRGDRAAAERLLRRETASFIDDLYTAPALYAAEVERVIASAPDHVAAQYRAAWALIPAAIEADRVEDETRGAAFAEQIERDFDALPELNGGRMWMILDTFYHASRPGFKLADEDLGRIFELVGME